MQADFLQPGTFQQDPFGIRPAGDVYPTAMTVMVPWLALSGTFSETVESSTKYRAVGLRPLTLRCRFSDPVRVRVQRRPLSVWHDCFDHTGMEFSSLVKVPGGGDMKIVVEGDAEGNAELVGG